MDGLEVYRSPDGRIRTDKYADGSRFCVAEATSRGTLITEFADTCEVTAQLYFNNKDFEGHLASYLSEYEIQIKNVAHYDKIEIKSACSKCATIGLGRELDIMLPERIREVPVMPIFVCKKCGQKHYSLTDEYLRSLVESNKHLFDNNELEDIEKDTDSSINTIKEYIIRIFASKRISRIMMD